MLDMKVVWILCFDTKSCRYVAWLCHRCCVFCSNGKLSHSSLLIFIKELQTQAWYLVLGRQTKCTAAVFSLGVYLLWDLLTTPFNLLMVKRVQVLYHPTCKCNQPYAAKSIFEKRLPPSVFRIRYLPACFALDTFQSESPKSTSRGQGQKQQTP
jgi:hypothetical protein